MVTGALVTQRALASLGVFSQVEPGRFALTPLAAWLQSDIPGSYRATPIHVGEELYRALGDLLYSVTTGQPAFDRQYGMGYFDYLAQHPDAAWAFNGAMTAIGDAFENPAIAAAYDFSAVGTVVDVSTSAAATAASSPRSWPRTRPSGASCLIGPP
jgi:hypothetical protein